MLDRIYNTIVTIKIPTAKIAEICQRNHVVELSLFGSAARDEMRADSDVDVLVLFDPAAKIGFFELATLQEELTAALGRYVDVVPKDGLKSIIRDEVIAESRVLYRAA